MKTIERAMTSQPRAKHTGTVADYPDPDGDGWRFVEMYSDDETCWYLWERRLPASSSEPSR